MVHALKRCQQKGRLGAEGSVLGMTGINTQKTAVSPFFECRLLNRFLFGVSISGCVDARLSRDRPIISLPGVVTWLGWVDDRPL